MKMNKVFNPALVARTMLDLTPSSGYATKDEAQEYAHSLAEGLTVWSTIDIIVGLTMLFLSLFTTIPATVFLLFVCFAIGCPIIMTLGFSYGCLQQLTFAETRTIVRGYFFER